MVHFKRNSVMHYAAFAVVVLVAAAALYAMSGADVAAGVSMAATVYSAQMSNDVDAQVRKYPIDEHGKLRIAYFKYTNATGGTLADGTEIELCKLPPGRVRILPNLSRYRATAAGASRVLDIGHRTYYDTSVPITDTGEPDDDDAFVANKDISGAVNDVAFDGGAAAMKFDMFSRGEDKVLYATVDGGTIPNGFILEGYVIYVHE